MARATTPSWAGRQAPRLLHPHAALAVLVVGAVLVLAQPTLRLVLRRTGAALQALLPIDPVAIRDVLDGVRAAGCQQRCDQRSLHTRSTECTPGILPMAR